MSTIDLNTASVAHASLERMERLANTIIAEDRPLSIQKVSSDEARRLLADGKLRKLPEREGDIRLIEIEGIDLNACGGTHVRSTGQIGGLSLRSTEKVRGGMRVEFVCGLRAIAAARRDFGTLTEAAVALSIGPEKLTETVQRLLAEARHGIKERQKLREELARLQALELLAKARPTNENLRVVVERFADQDSEYVKLLASRIAASGIRVVALLASTQREPAAVVMARTADLQFSCGELMKAALTELGLRGGGSPSLAQGQLPAGSVDGLFANLTAAVAVSAAP
jgi:alanyl-tRNA synthetase